MSMIITKGERNRERETERERIKRKKKKSEHKNCARKINTENE